MGGVVKLMLSQTDALVSQFESIFLVIFNMQITLWFRCPLNIRCESSVSFVMPVWCRFCFDVKERDTERQRVDELLEMNMSLEADLRQRSASKRGVSPTNVTIHQRFLQSELDSDEEFCELIGPSSRLSVP